jgi:hypothetical protein
MFIAGSLRFISIRRTLPVLYRHKRNKIKGEIKKQGKKEGQKKAIIKKDRNDNVFLTK